MYTYKNVPPYLGQFYNPISGPEIWVILKSISALKPENSDLKPVILLTSVLSCMNF